MLQPVVVVFDKGGGIKRQRSPFSSFHVPVGQGTHTGYRSTSLISYPAGQTGGGGRGTHALSKRTKREAHPHADAPANDDSKILHGLCFPSMQKWLILHGIHPPFSATAPDSHTAVDTDKMRLLPLLVIWMLLLL